MQRVEWAKPTRFLWARNEHLSSTSERERARFEYSLATKNTKAKTLEVAGLHIYC
jgi:hypothetical protein